MMNERNNKTDNKKLIEELHAIVRAESEKPISEQDIDLIKECVDFFMELENCKKLTNEQIAECKRIIMQKAEEKNPSVKNYAKKRSLKVLLAAACLAIILLVANVAAIACDFDGAAFLKSIEEYIAELLPGESIEYEENTIIQRGDVLIYNSVEAFASEGNVSVLYPTEWPVGTEASAVRINKALVADNTLSEEYFDITYSTGSPYINLTVCTDPNTDKQFLNEPSLIKESINGYDCYMFTDVNIAQCYFVYKDCVYTAVAQNTEDIKLIINSLKEIKNNE